MAHIGPNMKKLHAAAKRAGTWVPTKNAAERKAAESLKAAGLAKLKTSGNVVYLMAKDAPSGRGRSRSTQSKFQQAVAHAQARKPDRPAFVTWLKNKLDMTDAGANTYATAALKVANENRATRH